MDSCDVERDGGFVEACDLCERFAIWTVVVKVVDMLEGICKGGLNCEGKMLN